MNSSEVTRYPNDLFPTHLSRFQRMLPILFAKSWESHLANLPSLINQIIRGHLCRYPLHRTWGTGIRSIESFPLFRYVDRWLWWEAKTLNWFPYNEPGTIAVDCPHGTPHCVQFCHAHSSAIIVLELGPFQMEQEHQCWPFGFGGFYVWISYPEYVLNLFLWGTLKHVVQKDNQR